MAGRRFLTEAQMKELFEKSSGDENSEHDSDSSIDPDYNPTKDSSDDDTEDACSGEEIGKQADLAADEGQAMIFESGQRNTYDTEENTEEVRENINEGERLIQARSDANVRPTARLHQRTGNILTRKRSREPSRWKCNIRKQRRQSGKEYVNSRGNVRVTRSTKTKKDCTKCKFKCCLNISEKDRSDVFREFWTLNDNEKLHFFSRTTKQTPTNRPQVGPSRRRNSFTYYLPLNGQNIRVCKMFYLSTLDINHKRIRTYHNSKHEAAGTPAALKWGKSANRVIAQEIKDGIREHINSIPRIESHYCRATTNKEYIDSGLSISLLYEKYVDKCAENGTKTGKLHLYRQIFNSEFNIAFHVPKKDRCDTCEAMAMNEAPSDEEKAKYDSHVHGKLETKTEREKDRNEANKFTVCFDLQNVFALPTADVSNFFYRQKLNVYHMTAHCSGDKRGYGALWHEALSGRTGNDIASAVMKLLELVVEENANDSRIKHITLWSDSCVPQNRNSIFSTAVKVFLKQHPEIQSIEHKFCEPGHSVIQEVDNLHSQIERVYRNAEIYSPVGLVRMLKKVNRCRPLKLIQMKPQDFKDFHTIAQQGCYQRVPFTKVKSLLFEKNGAKIVKYKKRFSDDWTVENVITRKNTRSGVSEGIFEVPDPGPVKTVSTLSEAKKADIKAMLKFMPPTDKVYMSNVIAK